MNFALALFVAVGFAAMIEHFDLPDRARTVGERSGRSLEVLRDSFLADREKEEILQQQAGELFRLLGILVGGSTCAPLLSGRIPVWTDARPETPNYPSRREADSGSNQLRVLLPLRGGRTGDGPAVFYRTRAAHQPLLPVFSRPVCGGLPPTATTSWF